MPSPELSLVLTVYNEERSLRPLQAKIDAALSPLGKSYEIIYVDDGSTDSSGDLLARLAARDDRIRVVSFAKNQGKAAGLRAGFAAATAPVIVTLDADLQDEPCEIGRLLTKMEEGYDLVVGWKRPRRDPLSKVIPSWVANFINGRLSGLPIHDVDSGLKTYRRQVIPHLDIRGDLYRFLPVMAHHAGFRVTEVPVKHNRRQFSHSKYGAGRFLTGFLDIASTLAITRLRDRPAHLGLLLGSLVSTPSAALTAFVVYELTDGETRRSRRAARSLLAGMTVATWTTLSFAALGVMWDLLISQVRRSD